MINVHGDIKKKEVIEMSKNKYFRKQFVEDNAVEETVKNQVEEVVNENINFTEEVVNEFVDETVEIAFKYGIKCIILCDTAHRIERKNAEIDAYKKKYKEV